MLLRNLNSKLINGSRGVVVGFKEISEDDKAVLIEKGISSEWIAKNKVIYRNPIFSICKKVFTNCPIFWSP